MQRRKPYLVLYSYQSPYIRQTMSFCLDEEPENPSSKRCRCLLAPHEETPEPSKIRRALRDAFSSCHSFLQKLSSSQEEEDHDNRTSSDFDYEEVFVSEVISKYMESKARRLTADSFSWALSPETRELFITRKTMKADDVEAMDDFISACSEVSRCSSVASVEHFGSARATFSRSSSLSRVDFMDVEKRRLIIEELSHCQGWPFGMCKRAMLLPPLPKSPSDSWSWRKSTLLIKI